MKPIGILHIKRGQESFHYLMTDCKPLTGKTLVVYILRSLTFESMVFSYRSEACRYDTNIWVVIEENHKKFSKDVEKICVI